MSDTSLGDGMSPRRRDWRTRLNHLAASRRFQKWAARFPLTRAITRREGEEIFDLVSGFVQTQCLTALIELNILSYLINGPSTLHRLSAQTQVPQDRLRVLLRAADAMRVLRIDGNDVWLTRRGAALSTVPGLADMIRHHAVLYRDLSDPVAFFRAETKPELADFWPYVFGAGAAEDPATAARYSRLMAESQTLVAEETLKAVSLNDSRHLLDVGGGTGAFLSAALEAAPHLRGTLFDLPAVVEAAGDRFQRAGQGARVRITPGSFRDQSLPEGADTISLVRVLYDHTDETVRSILEAAFDALPQGGRIIVSEPMLGRDSPSKPGDGYFAIYTMAMGTGRTRSASDIVDLLSSAGFSKAKERPTHRSFITSVVTGVREN